MKRKSYIALLLIFVLLISSVPAMAVSSKARQVAVNAYSQMGKPYKLSSNPPHSFNCATLVSYSYNKVKSGAVSSSGKVNVPYKKIRSKGSLKVGDIVCFKISSGSKPKILNYHFGIYCGKGYFIHASRSSGRVVCSKVGKFNGKFLGGIRIF